MVGAHGGQRTRRSEDVIRLSCASLSFDGFGDEDFVHTFAKVRDAGYRHLEFNCWYPRTLTPAKTRDLGERCAQAEVSVGSIHVSSFGGEGSHGLTKDLCHKLRAIEAVKELGGSVVCATGAGRGKDGGCDAIIAVLKELMPAAEESGVLISLENHAANNLENLDDYRRIFDAVDSPALGICMDTGHFEAASVSLDDLIDEFWTKINHVHLKENRSFGVKEFVRFGEGTTDNAAAVERMIDKGYSGYLVIELSPEIGAVDGRPFTIDDLKKPYEMFVGYESE
ncbi:MAG: sugar phosphate isomerase/epimerase [Spirochaetaceae bacterium]|nr:MAG: sugar phosphate isomerase/epimerase [Spirochaetaceae bacterium]